MPRPTIVLSVLPLVLLLSVASCDSATHQPSGLPLADVPLGAAVTMSAAPSACFERTLEVLDLAKKYSSDVKGVQHSCRDGDVCEPELAVTKASFAGLVNGHAGLVFACTPASPEVCDGYDNDKDGPIDEDFPDKGSVCSAGIGACRVEGAKVCSADGSGTVCNAEPRPASAETCDDSDNDCDGVTDETFPDKGMACAVGVGACMRFGYRICSDDRLGTTCSAMAGTPEVEICDGRDNNCDGVTDEGCSAP